MVGSGLNRLMISLFSDDRGEASTPLLVALGIAGFAAAAYFLGSSGGGEEVSPTPVTQSSGGSQSSQPAGGSSVGGGGSSGGSSASANSYELPQCFLRNAACDCEDFLFDSEYATWFLRSYDPTNIHRLDMDNDGHACEEGADKLSIP